MLLPKPDPCLVCLILPVSEAVNEHRVECHKDQLAHKYAHSEALDSLALPEGKEGPHRQCYAIVAQQGNPCGRFLKI